MSEGDMGVDRDQEENRVEIRLKPGGWVDVYGPAMVRHVKTLGSGNVTVSFDASVDDMIWRDQIAERLRASVLEEMGDHGNLVLTSVPGDIVTVDGPFRYIYIARVSSLPRGIRYAVMAHRETVIHRGKIKLKSKRES